MNGIPCRSVLIGAVIAAITFLACTRESGEVHQKPLTLEEDRQVTVKRSLALLESSLPDSDAVQAMRRGDTSLIGLMGSAVQVPGVKGNDERFKNILPIRVIDGTGDVLETDDDRELHDVAWRYAERYNAAILNRLHSRLNNAH